MAQVPRLGPGTEANMRRQVKTFERIHLPSSKRNPVFTLKTVIVLLVLIGAFEAALLIVFGRATLAKPLWSSTIKIVSSSSDQPITIAAENTRKASPRQPDLVEGKGAVPGPGDCHNPHPLLACSSDKFGSAETLQMRAATDDDLLNNRILRERGKHNSCALVGSSGNILKYEFGKEIDEHDLVIRINPPATVAHEYDKYIGSQFGDVIIYGSSGAVGPCPKLNQSQDYVLATTPGPMSLRRKANVDFIRDCWKTYSKKIYLLSGELSIKARALCNYVRKECLTTYKGRYVTAGLTTLLFTMHICRNVDIYGYGLNEAEQFEYHRNKTMKSFYSQKTVHDWMSESRLLDYLTSNSDAPKKFVLEGYDYPTRVRRRGASYDVPGATRCLPTKI